MPKIYTVWNFSIFLPLWFYVKSIVADFRRSKTAVLTILEAMTFDFWKNFMLENVKNSQKFNKLQMVRIAVFGASKLPKLISRKIYVAEKSWIIHIVDYHTQFRVGIIKAPFKHNYFSMNFMCAMMEELCMYIPNWGRISGHRIAEIFPINF